MSYRRQLTHTAEAHNLHLTLLRKEWAFVTDMHWLGGLMGLINKGGFGVESSDYMLLDAPTAKPVVSRPNTRNG